MPRLRNVRSGAVVSCSDETAARLGSEWVPVGMEVPPKPAPLKKPARKPAQTK